MNQTISIEYLSECGPLTLEIRYSEGLSGWPLVFKPLLHMPHFPLSRTHLIFMFLACTEVKKRGSRSSTAQKLEGEENMPRMEKVKIYIEIRVHDNKLISSSRMIVSLFLTCFVTPI